MGGQCRCFQNQHCGDGWDCHLALKNAIESSFKRRVEIDARRINIETNNGKVILRGHVRFWAERNKTQ